MASFPNYTAIIFHPPGVQEPFKLHNVTNLPGLWRWLNREKRLWHHANIYDRHGVYVGQLRPNQSPPRRL